MPPPEAAAGNGEPAVLARALRAERVPQLVGMVVAARLLGAELPRQLASDARGIADGHAIAGLLGCDEDAARKLGAALAAWLLDRAQAVAARCAEHADEWLGEAHRAEGRADAIEEMLQRGSAAAPPAG